MAVRFLQGVKFSGGTIRFADPVSGFTPVAFDYAYELNTLTTSYVTATVTPPSNDIFPLEGRNSLLGSKYKFTSILLNTSVNMPNVYNGDGFVYFYYFNGSTWSLATSSDITNFDDLETTTVLLTGLNDWQPVVINGNYAYWIRFTSNVNYFTAGPPFDQFYNAQVSSITGTEVTLNTYTVTTFTTPGSNTWTKPNGVTEVVVECWAGGGAGGGAGASNSAGGGGAGGQYARKTLTYASAQQSISYTVGSGGIGGTGAGPAGGDSTWNTTDVVAKGGAGGGAGVNGGTATAGAGTTTGGVGDVVRAGGNGVNGSTAQGYSGGGGGCGSFIFTANNAPGTLQESGATSVFEGGSGGDGRSISEAGGTPLSGQGGGGGGGYRSGGGAQNGGNGANGLIRISYR